MSRLILSRIYLVFFVYNVGLNGIGVRRSTLLHFSRNSICKKDLCRRYPHLVPPVKHGLLIALRECQNQFKYRRWNCSESAEAPSMEKIMRSDFRESAFVLAINAAGVTYSVTRACAKGELAMCECDAFVYRGENMQMTHRNSVGEYHTQGVCSQNLKQGEHVSRLIFAGGKTKDARSALVRWNYEAGRQALRKKMRRSCSCIGASGSCTQKTCWTVLPQTFKTVGAALKRRFDNATKVTFDNNGRTFHPADESVKKPTAEDLVYTTDSPSFCEKDPKIGSFGTIGRYCNATSMGTYGCDLMCCQRGFTTETIRKEAFCKCKFLWCCKVACEKCRLERKVNVCL